MYTLGIILLFLVGYLVVLNLSTETTRLERAGLAFPIGIGAVTFCMSLMDLTGIPLTRFNLTAATCIIAVLMFAMLFRKRQKVLAAFVRPLDTSSFNFVWLLFLVFIVWIEYANFSKCMFFPVYDRDSLAAFDTMGFVAAQEHTYGAMSIFSKDYMQGIHDAGSPIAYYPLLQLAYAYVYAFGAETSKIVPALMYASFLVAFYAIVSKSTSRTAAMAATLFVILTPEMTSFSSLSGTNVINAVYASLGIIYILTWFGGRESQNLAIGSLLLACNVWSRAEGIVFVASAGILVLFVCIKKRKLRSLIPIVLTLIPVVLWMIYTRCFGMTTESFVITHPFFDSEKATLVVNGAMDLLTNTQYYGWTFAALLIAVVADVYFMFHRGADIAKLTAIVMGMVFYFTILYQIDYKWDSINNVLAYSAKRFMFCFVPLAWYFVATCTPIAGIMKKFDAFISK